VNGVDLNDRLTALASDGGEARVVRTSVVARGMPAEESFYAVKALRELLPEVASGLWVTVSPQQGNADLGEMLQQLRSAGHAVNGFVDRAAVLAAWLQQPGSCALLDVSRHGASISVVVNDGAMVALRRTVRLAGGEAALHDAWLKLAAATLVQQTRFDPLHDQRQEQQLREQLPTLAAEALRDGQGHCVIDAGGSSLSLTLTRDQLVGAADGWLQPLASALQSFSAAMDDCVLLVPASLLDIPGMSEVLVTARFAKMLRIADGAAARAASLLPAANSTASGGVQYLMRVPLFAAGADPDVAMPLDLRDNSGAAAATHVVYNGRVLPIPAAGLVIGRDPGNAGLRLPDGIAGLSRQHCTLRNDGSRTQVVDHSSFGSFVDGVRVRGRALLAAGSVLRLGEPGIELPLVALGSSGSAD
jgi:hypothetical protein